MKQEEKLWPYQALAQERDLLAWENKMFAEFLGVRLGYSFEDVGEIATHGNNVILEDE